MRNDRLKAPESNAIANAPVPAEIAVRGEDGCGAVLSREIGNMASVHVGDAGRVIERYFRKRAIAASAASAKSIAGVRYPITYSLLRKSL